MFRLLTDCPRSGRLTDRRTSLAAARHAAAQLSGRGVVILLSDLLDPAADRVIRELAATRSELVVLHSSRRRSSTRRWRAISGSSTPRPARASTSPPTSPRSTPTRPRLAAWKAGLRLSRRPAPGDLRRRPDDAAAQRPHLRRAPPPARGGLRLARRDALRRAARAARPPVRAGCASRCTCSGFAGDESDRPVDAALAAARGRRRGQRAVAAAAAEPPAAPPAPPGLSSRCSPRGPSSSGRPGWPRDLVLIIDTSASMAATDVAAGPARRAKSRRIDALKDLPGRRQGQRDRGGADRPGRRPSRPATSAGSAPAIDGIRPPATAATWATPCPRPAARRPSPATPRSSSRRTRRSRSRRRRRSTPRSGSSGSATRPAAGTRRSWPWRSGPRLGGHPLGLRERREPGPRAGPAAARDLRRRPPPRGTRPSGPRPADAGRRDHRRRPGDAAVDRGPPDAATRSGRAADLLALDDRAWAILAAAAVAERPPRRCRRSLSRERPRFPALHAKGECFRGQADGFPCQGRPDRRHGRGT